MADRRRRKTPERDFEKGSLFNSLDHYEKSIQKGGFRKWYIINRIKIIGVENLRGKC